MSTITLGIDLGDRTSSYCQLDAAGRVTAGGKLRTTPAALERFAAGLPSLRVVLEVGTHSPWVSRLFAAAGHEVIVANPRRVRLISAAVRKSDTLDAEALARLGRLDPALLAPIQHRGADAQADLALLRSRDALVRTRTLLVNHVRGSVKALGTRLPASSARSFGRTARSRLPVALAPALTPLLDTLEAVNTQIVAADRTIAQVADLRYPETHRLRQIAGVGPITALCFVLTLEDPRRFPRAAGWGLSGGCDRGSGSRVNARRSCGSRKRAMRCSAACW
jgi:transposase